MSTEHPPAPDPDDDGGDWAHEPYPVEDVDVDRGDGVDEDGPDEDGPDDDGPDELGSDTVGPDDVATDDDDLARMMLAGARGTSRTARRRPGRRGRRADVPGRNRGGYSGPGPDPARDPQRIGALLPGYVADLGWEAPMADARVFAQWSTLVGADVAAHCEPQSLRDGELRITAESTAWATQLRMLASTLLARLVAELGSDVVRKLVISGPTAPSWKYGPRSLRNGRGPRDTYG